MEKETTLERPFMTVLDLGISTQLLARKINRAKAITDAMADKGLRPATADEIRETLKTTPHCGYDIISLVGDGPFFAARMNRRDPSYHETTLDLINGIYQWFAVKPIN